jgi:organic hydroperoxide reductase OsmC/OhrA
MSEHRATIEWTGAVSPDDFRRGRYSRAHRWTFDGGAVVEGSSSPSVVALPWSNAANVDPEEAYVASISSCHMLTFLFLAMKAGFEVASYDDDAVGTMTKNERGIPWVSSVVLTPRIVFGARRPSEEELQRLHHDSHEQCYIANSVKTDIHVRGALRQA